MAESNFQIITGNGATATVVAYALANATNYIMQSIPTNVSGTAMIGSSVMASSIPVTMATDQLPIAFNITQLAGTNFTLGQAVMATSVPVVIASNQANLTTIIANASITALVSGTVTAVVSGTVTANLAGGANAIGTVTALQGGAPWSDNITQIAGTNFTLGQAVMATSLPVVISSNQSNLTTIIANASITALVTGTVTANLAAGSNAIGTVTALQGGAPWSDNITQVNGQTIATGGAAGLFTVGGPAATNSAIVGWPVLLGGRSQTAEIATTTSGNAVMAAFDAVGRIINFPFANKENYVAGATSSVATTLLQVIASVNATNRIYITSMQFGNTSGSTVFLTFNDLKTSNFVVPAGGGSNIDFPMPLQFTLGSSVTFSTSLAVSTVYVNAQGFSGT